MTIASKMLKVKVNVVGQANAVGPTSIEGSFYRASSALAVYAMVVCLSVLSLIHI